MDTFEFNKIAGALLGTVLLFFGLNILSEGLFHTEAPDFPGYVIEVPESVESAEAEGDEPISIAILMQDASAENGATVAKKCQACHTFESGEPNKVGPNLWNVLNRPVASVADFAYSDAMKAYGAQGEEWSYERLREYLNAPKKVVPGTNMAFAGLRKDADLANIIQFLRLQSPDPAPLPEPEPSADPEDAAMANQSEETQLAMAEADAEVAESEKIAESITADTNADDVGADMADDAETADAAATEPAAPAADAAGGDDAMTSADTTSAGAPDTDTAQMAVELAPAANEAEETQTAATADAQSDDGAVAEGGEAGDLPAAVAMVATADPAAGEKVAKKCIACHAMNEGGKNKIGPPLWGIVDRPVGTADGFKYSDNMLAFAEGGRAWTYVELDAYLQEPKAVVPKGKMAFAGVKKEDDRASLLAYLRTLAAEPAPLP